LSLFTEKTNDFGKDDRRIDEYYCLGFKILVGKNAISNEALIKENAKLHPEFIWMHAAGSKGAHLIICAKLVDIPDIVMRRAATLALRNSLGKLKEVMWSELRDLYKPQSDLVGVWKTWKNANVIKL